MSGCREKATLAERGALWKGTVVSPGDLQIKVNETQALRAERM